MYMPDAVKATLEVMESESEKIRIRSSYNIGAMSFCPEEIYKSVKRHYPDFTITYIPDFRQKIADSWPENIDDTPARQDWGWNHDYDLNKMTDDMLKNLRERIPTT